MNPPARVALTPGEPAGIGPDLCLQLACDGSDAELVAVADPTLLRERARTLGLAVKLEELDPAAPPRPTRAGTLRYRPVDLRDEVTAGQLNPANAAYVLETLRAATDACLQGQCEALVTAPVHKGVINDAGIRFSGHTEFLAEITGTEQVVMMLTTPGLRVALATTHLPLAQVSRAITQPGLERTLRILVRDLRKRFAIPAPTILVCGLNPHAGEGGHLGHEEIEVIEPVLDRLRAEGLDLRGPLPADTLFLPKYLDNADAVLAMYHDQGLPVLKHMGFGRAVNVTLGLPIIRTSVDHGTALDLAATGRAETGSLRAAVDLACRLAANSRSG